MKAYIIGAIIGVVLSTVFYAYKLSQPGSVKISISLNKEDIDSMLAQFNPAANINLNLNDKLTFKCPGTKPQTCSLNLLPMN